MPSPRRDKRRRHRRKHNPAYQDVRAGQAALDEQLATMAFDGLSGTATLNGWKEQAEADGRWVAWDTERRRKEAREPDPPPHKYWERAEDRAGRMGLPAPEPKRHALAPRTKLGLPLDLPERLKLVVRRKTDGTLGARRGRIRSLRPTDNVGAYRYAQRRPHTPTPTS